MKPDALGTAQNGTRFRLYRGRRVPFLRFALPDSFLAVPSASSPVFTFCALGYVFGRTYGVGSRIHVLRSRTRFRRYRGSRVPFSCFAYPDTFSTVPRASGHVCKFCALGLVLGGAECVEFRFHVLRALNFFRQYRGRRVQFSCFALADSSSAVPGALGTVFMFCAPGQVFGSTEGVASRFHVLCSRTSFQRYRGRQVSYSCFALSDSFLAVPGASGLVFTFCAVGLVFGGTDGVGSRFHVLRSRTRFRLYRGRRVPFLRFALPDSFLTVTSASRPVFTFCTLVLIFGGTEGVASRFHILRTRTRFRRYRGCLVLFSSFALPESFSAVPSASVLVFT
jgi:hypothetical protein